MENNNSIPYGTISWDNEDSFSQTNQQRESQRTPFARNHFATEGNYNGLRYALRGPHFPPPQQRLEGVGLSRQMGLAHSRQEQLQSPHSNVQQLGTSNPSSTSPNDVQYERFFSLRPVLNLPSTHVQTTQPPTTDNLINENQTFSSPFFNSLPRSASVNDPSTGFSISNEISLDSPYNNNNNVHLLQDASPREGRTKRKSSYSDSEEGQDGPASKQFLSEERMAARMHNLRISNDHNYPVNVMQTFLDEFVVRRTPDHFESQFANDDDGEVGNNNESAQERPNNIPVFVLHPEVKDALNENQANSIIPEAIYKQMSNPCLAVIPWKSPDEALNFPTESTSANQDKIESDFSCSQSSSSSSSSNSSRMSLVIESIPETEQFQDKGVHHVEIVGDCSTFSLEDDDMEP